jgi:hypothetical protein
MGILLCKLTKKGSLEKMARRSFGGLAHGLVQIGWPKLEGRRKAVVATSGEAKAATFHRQGMLPFVIFTV